MEKETLIKINNQKFGTLDFSFNPKHFRDKDLGKKQITLALINLIEQSPKLKERLAGKKIASAKFTAVPKRELNIILKD